MEDRLPRPAGDDRGRHVAGRDDAVISLADDAEFVEQVDDIAPRPWRIGDQHHRAARLAESGKRLSGLRKRRDAVVHHAPDVAENDIIERSETEKVVEE